MKLRLCRLLAIAAFVCFLGSIQTLAQNAYVTNDGSGDVSVIDTATNTVTATITVGTAPFAVAVSPDGGTVYVANIDSDNVSAIATATNKVIATITVGSSPEGGGQPGRQHGLCSEPALQQCVGDRHGDK